MSFRTILVTLALGASACVSSAPQSPSEPMYPDPVGQSNGPTYEGYQQASNPSWSGPPGGGMDPSSGYGDPQNPQGYPQNPQSYPQNQQYGDQSDSTPIDSSAMDSSAPDSTAQDSSYYGSYSDPNAADPNAGYGYGGATGTGDVTDAEIDNTLQPYGEWVEDPSYGNVWRPYATVVGADFTPYDTCGTWAYTDYGWTFNCSWDWGWLPFHYGRWVYLDTGWCWTRDYSWGPGWVDWRRGNGYVGWQPQAPSRVIRDHRHAPTIIRDHRHLNEGKWTFTGDNDFGRGPRHNRVDVATGLRNTTSVAQPPRGEHRTPLADVMRARANRNPTRPGMAPPSTASNPRGPRDGQWNRNPAGNTWNRPQQQPVGQNGFRQPNNGWNRNPQQPSVQQGNRSNWNQPHYSGPRTWTPQQNTGPRYNPPSGSRPTSGGRPSYGNYNPPTSGGRPAYNPPSQSYNPPSRQNYNPPSRQSYNPPSAPSRPSYSPPSRPSYSPPSSPSRSSGSFGGGSRSSGSSSHSSGSFGGGSRSSGGGGHFGGGGGRHR